MHFSPRTRPLKPPFLKSLRLDNFLSFAPGSEAIELQGLNVLIGPNGSGKSNVIEAMELLKSLPVDFAAAVRMGGGAEGFLWKGRPIPPAALIEVHSPGVVPGGIGSRYILAFTYLGSSTIILDELDDGALIEDKNFGKYAIFRVRPESSSIPA